MQSLINIDIYDLISLSRCSKYEKDEAQTSVENAKKIADALDVTLDYLVDEEALPTFDKVTVGRLKSIQSLDEENSDSAP